MSWIRRETHHEKKEGRIPHKYRFPFSSSNLILSAESHLLIVHYLFSYYIIYSSLDFSFSLLMILHTLITRTTGELSSVSLARASKRAALRRSVWSNALERRGVSRLIQETTTNAVYVERESNWSRIRRIEPISQRSQNCAQVPACRKSRRGGVYMVHLWSVWDFFGVYYLDY